MGKQWLALVVIALVLGGCSSTNSESRNFVKLSDEQKISSSRMHIDISDIKLSLQASGRLYTLHARPSAVKTLFAGAAKQFGFREVALEDAVYQTRIKSVYPDAGQCEALNSSVVSGFSYSMSILTLGVVPATMTHCFVVKVELWERIDGEWLEIGAFESQEGRVDVYGGVNDINNYQLTVTVRDEARAIETSMAALLEHMIKEGAFE